MGPLSSKLLFAPRDCLLDQGKLFQPPPVCDIRPYRAPSQFGYFDLLLFIARFLLLDNCSQLRLIDDALPLVDIAGTASAGVGALSQVAGLAGFSGGRTRARTWDPLIKSHAVKLDFSSEFFQLNQNLIIRDRWLTATNQTGRGSGLADRCIRGVGGSRHWSATYVPPDRVPLNLWYP